MDSITFSNNGYKIDLCCNYSLEITLVLQKTIISHSKKTGE